MQTDILRRPAKRGFQHLHVRHRRIGDERDRLIRALAATLHPRAALPESAPERATPAKAKGHGGSNRRPSPLSRTRSAAAEDNELTSDLTAYLGADGHCCPSSPTPSFDSTCSPSGDDAPSSFRSDSSDAEDDAEVEKCEPFCDKMFAADHCQLCKCKGCQFCMSHNHYPPAPPHNPSPPAVKGKAGPPPPNQ